MEKQTARYDPILALLHWLVVLLVVSLLVLGCYLAGLPESQPVRESVSQWHISLGLTSIPVLAFFVFWRLMHGAPPSPDYVSRWLRYLDSALSFLLHVCLLLAPLSGYLQLAFGTQPLSFWGMPAPLWGWPDETLSGRFRLVHTGSACLLGALAAIHVIIVLFRARKHAGFLGRMMPARSPQGREGESIASSDAVRAIRKVARNLRVLGWLTFWVQLAVAVLAGLLLLFAGSGRSVSADSAGIELGMFWAGCGIAALFLTVVLSFRGILLARKMLRKMDVQVTVGKKSVQRFVKLAALVGIVGMALGIVGVGVSISVLIAKVVSQPPGIAITDPERIIRALDVFVLLANFGVICGHFAGTITYLWLLSRVRHLYPQAAAGPQLLPAPAGEAATPSAGK